MSDVTQRVQQAVALLRRARHVIALTGAGISTPSGVPDFRSPGSGLWEQVDPMEVASILSFRRHPEAFYRWVRPMLELILNAQPNPAHLALAQLEAGSRLHAILTQNIDNLHQRAGSRSVLELHGHLRTLTCLECFRSTLADGVLDIVMRGEVPRCAFCGGVAKPDAVLFGEQLPATVMTSALEHVRTADLVLVAGSSLMVMPVAKFPALVRSGGGQVIVVNNQETYADSFAAVVFREDVEEILPALAQSCLQVDR